MCRAGVSRTAFYRQFDSIYDVFAELMVRVASDLVTESGSWIAAPEAVGSPDVVYPNVVGYARAFTKYRDILTALHDVSGADDQLCPLWHERLIRPFINATPTAIARDQAAGAVSPNLDPAATALALTLMSEAASVELLGLRRLEPEEDTRVSPSIGKRCPQRSIVTIEERPGGVGTVAATRARHTGRPDAACYDVFDPTRSVWPLSGHPQKGPHGWRRSLFARRVEWGG